MSSYVIAKRFDPDQSSGWNPELRSPQTQSFLFLLHSSQLHRPFNVATVPLEDGAQPLQQNHAGGASHGCSRTLTATMQDQTDLTARASLLNALISGLEACANFDLYTLTSSTCRRKSSVTGFITPSATQPLSWKADLSSSAGRLSRMLLCAAQRGNGGMSGGAELSSRALTPLPSSFLLLGDKDALSSCLLSACSLSLFCQPPFPITHSCLSLSLLRLLAHFLSLPLSLSEQPLTLAAQSFL